ncbi:uncharacterized protein EV420DRAFT_1682098 [Desarmillaria tabescens]|uniref:DUF7223 domain-containing protein n=1 Tax=Armillaria tabescens TaxID=1929756 RepID=A0AA39KBS1_ARMTA|nr:uncharacterized protein EV420DRAFT_1682098 [Desarmillaria tabescens]KAK0458185.1 hypothetical protein EV420DRAFT_1682098 [Desarmillaria tabescens]
MSKNFSQHLFGEETLSFFFFLSSLYFRSFALVGWINFHLLLHYLQNDAYLVLYPHILSFVTVLATNDWSQPCFNGVCEYSLPANGTASGSLKIWGSANALSDITPAAGWEIIDCAPEALTQEIRLVCLNNDTGSPDCDHLYQNDGAVGKIVRLPENCGQNAFARVARAWDPEDQSLPSNLAARVLRRDGTAPPVKALALDTNFSAVDSSKTGAISFILQGANVPNAGSDLSSISFGSRRRSRLSRRGFTSFVGDAIDVLGSVLDNDVNVDQTLDVPIDVDQTFNLLNESVSCQPIDAKLNINIAAKAHALATLGISASGTLVPPNINDFAIRANLDATLDGAIDLFAGVTGTLDSGKIPLFQVGIPGLDFPGILAIGPTFEIDAQAVAKLDVALDLNVGVVYNISKAQFVFPPNKSDNASGGSFDIGDTPLKLSVLPAANVTGTIEAHLIPRLNLGISALGDTLTANVFLELDANAALVLELDGRPALRYETGTSLPAETSSALNYSTQASVHGTSSPSVSASQDASTSTVFGSGRSSSIDDPSTDTVSYIPNAARYHRRQGHPTPVVDAARLARSVSASESSEVGSNFLSSITAGSSSALSDTSSSLGGCFSVNAGLNVNVGAEGTFFSIFDSSVSESLFSKDFELFQQCFGSQSNQTARRSTWPQQERLAHRSVLDLLCPTSDLAQAISVVNKEIDAASIQNVSS